MLPIGGLDETVCNDFGNRIPYDDYLRAFSEIRVPLRWPNAPPNLEPRDDIWPTEPAPVIRRREDGVELAQLRWCFPPAWRKGAPVINFRSEGRHFPVGRCLIPASHFFEFTGRKPPKSKWKFTKVGEDWFCFAGLWRPMPEGAGEAFTLLTTEPSPDVAPIHDRQMIVLERADWLAWLDLTRPEAELLRPLPPGSLFVEQVRKYRCWRLIRNARPGALSEAVFFSLETLSTIGDGQMSPVTAKCETIALLTMLG